MQRPAPYEVHTHVGEESRDTRALVGSVVVHLLVILLVLLRPAVPSAPDPASERETGQPVALDPQVPFRQDPERATPPPPQPIPEEPVVLGPDTDRPDDPPREQGPDLPPPEDANPPNLPTNDPPPSTTREEREEAARVPTPADLASTGQLLGSPTSPFPGAARGAEGPPPQGASAGASRPAVGAMGRTGFSNGDSRAWRQSSPQAAGQCVEIPSLGVNADGTPVLASVIGVVRDQRGRPLAGAHLQIMGAPYATFSDGMGRYRLEFDPSLLEKCRSQVVRVRADGYAEQVLNLGIGRQVVSDDVVLRRR